MPGGGLNIVRLLQDAVHLAADTFYQDWNDLVVNTTHVWAVNAAPGQFSEWLPADRLLIYNAVLAEAVSSIVGHSQESAAFPKGLVPTFSSALA